MTYQGVCGSESHVWFELGERRQDKVKFLKWAKSLGCLWLSGEEIHPHNSTGAHYLSIHSDGRIAMVNMWSWVAWKMKDEKDREKVISFDEWKEMIERK